LAQIQKGSRKKAHPQQQSLQQLMDIFFAVCSEQFSMRELTQHQQLVFKA